MSDGVSEIADKTTSFCGSCPKLVKQWEDGEATFRIVVRLLDSSNVDKDSVCFYVECLQHDAMNESKWEPVKDFSSLAIWQFSLLMNLRKRGES